MLHVWAAAALLAARPAAAQDPSKTVQVVAAAGFSPSFSTRLNEVFERVLAARPDVEIRDVETVAITHRGHEYELAVSTGEGRADALDTADAVFYLTPAEPELLEAVRAAARTEPSLPPVYAAKVRLSGGKAVVEGSDPVPDADRATLAVVYRLTVKGRRADAVFLLRTHGGVGRLATAVDELRRERLPRVVVSHGGWTAPYLRSAPAGRALLDALEKIGLQVAAVGPNELKRWDEFQLYRRERPGGIRFVSANLSAPDGVPPEVVLEVGGLTVAFLGLTDPSAARALPPKSPIQVEDPVEAAKARVAAVKPGVDLLVVLSNLTEADNARLRSRVRGIDVIVSPADETSREDDGGRGGSAFQEWRADFAPALMTVRQADGMERLDVAVGPRDKDGLRRLEIRRTERPLDETVATRADFPRIDLSDFRPGAESGPVLIPGEHRVFPAGGGRLTPHAFWSLAASVAADREGAEAAFLPVRELGAPTPGDFREREVRNWFGWNERLTVFDLDGDDLLDLVRQAGAESVRPTPGRPPLAVGGVGPKETIHGSRIDRALRYRVAGTEDLLSLGGDYPALLRARRPSARGALEDSVVGGLKDLAAAGAPPARYASLMEGDPVRETPLWIVNFRDVSLTYAGTRAVRDGDAFADARNDRINAFDSKNVGAVVRVETDYRYHGYKWTNSLNAQYSETRVYPPGRPRVVNLSNNRGTFQTNLTKNLGQVGPSWLSDSAGPSLGVMWDGDLKRRRAGARRRGVASVLPGVEAYDGSLFKSLQLSGTLQRDYSEAPPKSDYGLYARALFEHRFVLPGGTPARLVGETWSTYLFRRKEDQPGDLLLEGDANAKLAIPLWADVTLSPFVDLYFCRLKERPLTGYSVMTGVSLGFSRLWKPQYGL